MNSFKMAIFKNVENDLIVHHSDCTPPGALQFKDKIILEIENNILRLYDENLNLVFRRVF